MAYVHNGATELNFDGVDIDEVFFTVPIISVLQRYEQFIQIYVNDPNQHVPLPPKITRDEVVDDHMVRAWAAYKVPPLLLPFNCGGFAAWWGYCHSRA